MYLANIVSENYIQENNLLNFVKSLNEIDKRAPTLIIGWGFSKLLFPDRKLNILTKRIEDNISWTFTKRERRIEYEKDMKSFIMNILKNAEKKINYQYLNILTCSIYDIKNLIKNLINSDISYIYIHRNSFIYIYNNGNVIGIDFNMIDYLNIDRKKVYKYLYHGKNIVFFSDNFLNDDIRENINNNKIIPYLYLIQDDRNKD